MSLESSTWSNDQGGMTPQPRAMIGWSPNAVDASITCKRKRLKRIALTLWCVTIWHYAEDNITTPLDKRLIC